MNQISKFFQDIMTWGLWLIIPVGWEFTRAIISTLIIFLKHKKPERNKLEHYPMVTLLVPIYNSRNTLENCLKSIQEQSYPLDMIEVFLIDNGSKDSSYDIFEKFQMNNAKLNVWWYYSDKGKSSALNKGIFNSQGKYIINIDSDGWLDRDAIKNVVTKFETNPDISCMTGVVLTDIDLIEKGKKKSLKILQKCEFFEYTESFLVERNFQGTFNQIYTIAGAFSCFKKEVLFKTQMYNSETLGESGCLSPQP